jgi:dienelactone hydrolase
MIPAAVNYARMGAVVLLIDAPFARRPNGMSASVTMTEQDRREQIQLIVDLRRGVDLLLSRLEVDPGRLAYVGTSYGGAMGGLLAGVEDRLQAYVLQVGDGGLVTHLTGPEDRAAWLARPEDQRRQWVAWMWPIEPIHYVGCASPAALLFQNGTLDTAVPPADGLRYQKAGSEPKAVRWYQAGHALDATAYLGQADWLSETIGISVERLAVPVDPQVLAAYAGNYQFPDGVIVTIRVEGARIFIQVPNQGEYELLARSENQFYSPVGAGELTFYKNASSEVDRMAVVTGEGETIEAKKVP